MKKINYSLFTLFITLFVFTNSVCSQNANKSWSAKYESQKVFIENKGQFHIHNSTEPVLYAYDNGSTMIYFTAKGVTYSFLKRWEKEEKANEKEREQEEIKKGKTHAEIEAEERKMEFKTDVVKFAWENANPTVEIVPEEETNDYQSYNVKEKDGSEKNINYIKSYKKIIYKNLYPNIDVEYIFHPSNGIEYSLIVHPGADISKVKMDYSGNIKLKNNDLHIPTLFGDIVEHAPVTFYSDNKSEIISSRFVNTGKSISFELGAYNHSKTVIIDPWVQTPTLTNTNSVWECERDAQGNVYIIGGDMPMKLLKYNSAGVYQWTYNTTYDTANYWLGTFAVDLAGNSYVTSGSIAEIVKVNNLGSVVWNNSSPGGIFSSTEFWNISFNCDQTRLIIAGTAGFFPLRGAIFDLDVNTGNVMTTKVVGYDKAGLIGTPLPDEVRSICSAPNGKYYFLILDSIGRIYQDFTACSSNNSLLKINSTYDFAYYNPSYRYANSGIMAIRANKNFVYTQNGSTLHKRSLNSLVILSTVTIPGGINVGGVFGNPGQVPGSSGLDIDSCGNVYVGSSNGVYKYDANLNQIGFTALPFTVFDVTVSTAGNIIAAGSTTNSGVRTGYVQSIASFAACNPMTISCCNATVCPVPPMCSTASPITLSGGTIGGTWSGAGVNASTGVFNPATAGVGTHTIVYSLACGADSITIVVNACATLSACQETNGNITVSGGSGPYTWQKDSTYTDCSGCFGGICMPPICNGVQATLSTTFATGTTVTPPGTYPIHVTDSNSNILQITSLASLPNCSACPPLTATSASIVNVNCYGQSTGSFSVSTTGGASPYDYVLMNGATTVATFNNIAGSQSFTSLPAGTYTLNITDNNACPGTLPITITQPASALSVAISGSTPATCGSSNGSATALASGGTSGYNYSWSPSGGTAATASGLSAGLYTVTATDSKLCTSTATVTITSSGGASIAITSQTNVLCFGNSTGSATATASNGTSPYDYVWTNSSGTTLQTTNNITGSNTLSNMAAGTYTVTVTDNNSCVSTFPVTITQPTSAVSVAITASTDATCGSANGSATALASNGTSGYTYSWAPSGGSAATASNLSANTYIVTATDGNECTATATAVIGSSGGPTVTLASQTNVLCNGASTGSATVSAIGGTGNLTYSWSGSTANTATANSLSAGNYIVTVTDASNCSNTLPVTITQPNAITASVTTIPSNCGSSDGSATVNATGGTGSLTYLWSAPGGSSATLSNIPNGTYTATITDANLCVQTATGVVGSIGGPAANAGTNVTIVAGGNTVLNGTGTTGATYSWSPSTTLTNANSLTPTASPLQTTTYTLIVTQNGCSATDSVTVFVEMPCGEIFVPTAFSPNGGDAAENEVLKVYGNCILNLEFTIFDRWGEKVFETTDPGIGWDGTFKGKKLDTSVFVYFLKATVDGIEVKKHGNITLVK